MAAKCPMCGAPMEDGACGYCGYREKKPAPAEVYVRQDEPQPIPPQIPVMPMAGGITPGVSRKSKMTALLLGIFLGGIGAHRFYVGKVGTGILYLLTAGLFGIGWVVDICLIAAGSFRDGFGLPLQR